MDTERLYQWKVERAAPPVKEVPKVQRKPAYRLSIISPIEGELHVKVYKDRELALQRMKELRGKLCHPYAIRFTHLHIVGRKNYCDMTCYRPNTYEAQLRSIEVCAPYVQKRGFRRLHNDPRFQQEQRALRLARAQATSAKATSAKATSAKGVWGLHTLIQGARISAAGIWAETKKAFLRTTMLTPVVPLHVFKTKPSEPRLMLPAPKVEIIPDSKVQIIPNGFHCHECGAEKDGCICTPRILIHYNGVEHIPGLPRIH